MEYINLLIDRGLGNYMDSMMDEELIKDKVYIRMMEQAEAIKDTIRFLLDMQKA